MLEPSGIAQLCPGSNTSFVCTVEVANILNWRVNGIDSTNGYTKIYTRQTDPGFQDSVGDYTVWLVSTDPFVSIATLANNSDFSLNGTTLYCTSTINAIPTDSEVASVTLIFNGALRMRGRVSWHLKVSHFHKFKTLYYSLNKKHSDY